MRSDSIQDLSFARDKHLSTDSGYHHHPVRGHSSALTPTAGDSQKDIVPSQPTAATVTGLYLSCDQYYFYDNITDLFKQSNFRNILNFMYNISLYDGIVTV